MTPRYQTLPYRISDNSFTLVASGDSTDNAGFIHQDARVFLGSFDSLQEGSLEIRNGFGLFVFVIEGSIQHFSDTLRPRDSISITDVSSFEFRALENTQLLCIEVPLI